MEPNSKESSDEKYEKPNLKGDRLNFALLTFLYTLQFTSSSMAQALPIILQNRRVTYEDQGEFDFVWYPNTLKMLWAPIVDSIYIKTIGRRKSWVVGALYIIGVLYVLLWMNIDNWMGTEDGEQKPNVRMLTVTFFFCILSGTLQDIALDAWSLTMLQKKNVAYYTICESIGFSFGYFAVPVGLIMLESKDFSNRLRSVPQDYGLVSCSQFAFFMSILIIISTTLILLFKKEKVQGRDDFTKVDDEDNRLTIIGTYTLLWKMLGMRPILIVVLLLVTCNIGDAPVDKVAPLKLLAEGITSDTVVSLQLPTFPLQLCLPLLMKRYITGRRPLRTFLLLYILRLMNACVYTSFVYLISYWKNEYNVLPTWYFWPVLFTYNIQNVLYRIILSTLCATCARISDPRFGGVYMAFFNSVINVGRLWPRSLSLWLMNILTIRSCSRVDKIKEESCYTLIDGFYVETVLFTTVGVLWIYWGRKMMNYIEEKNASAFRVHHSPATNEISLHDERSEPLMNKQ